MRDIAQSRLPITLDEFKKSGIPETRTPGRLRVFSFAFATARYNELCEFSQAKDPHANVLQYPWICLRLKERIEEAKTEWDALDFLLEISNAEMHADKLKDTPFSDLMKNFGLRTREYLRDVYVPGQSVSYITRPIILPIILENGRTKDKNAYFMERISQHECNQLTSLCCMTTCLINGIVQIPLNVAWFALSVGCLGLPPAIFSKCSSSGRVDSDDITVLQAFCFPIERLAIKDAKKFDSSHGCVQCCIPFSGVRAKYGLYKEESQQVVQLRHAARSSVFGIQ